MYPSSSVGHCLLIGSAGDSGAAVYKRHCHMQEVRNTYYKQDSCYFLLIKFKLDTVVSYQLFVVKARSLYECSNYGPNIVLETQLCPQV
jgi:hypothetical protein